MKLSSILTFFPLSLWQHPYTEVSPPFKISAAINSALLSADDSIPAPILETLARDLRHYFPHRTFFNRMCGAAGNVLPTIDSLW